MDDNNISKNEDESYRNGMVHFILSHSYTVYLLAVVFGLIFDMLIPMRIFSGIIYQYLGIFMIIFGSFIIYWAQSTSSSTKKEEIQKQDKVREFARGPYKYTRNPTHIGLSIMTMGLGFLLGSVFSVLFIFVAYFITKLIFLKEEEVLLEERYGQDYLDYKKKVSTWL